MTGVAGGVRERHSLHPSVDGASDRKHMKKRPRPDRLVPTPVPTPYGTVPTDWPTYSPTSLEGAPSKVLRIIEWERERRRKREEEEARRKRDPEDLPRGGASHAPSPSAGASGPIESPSAPPSAAATTGTPSGAPSGTPSAGPSGAPTPVPTGAPTSGPSAVPDRTAGPSPPSPGPAGAATGSPTGECAPLNPSRCKKNHSCVLLRSETGDGGVAHECAERPTASPTTSVPTDAPTASPAGTDRASKVSLTLGPDETAGPSEFSLTTWGLEGAEAGPAERHGGVPRSERIGSGFSLSAGSLGGSGGAASSGDGGPRQPDGASKVGLSFAAPASPAASSDPGSKVGLSFELPGDDTPSPTEGPSGEPTYLLFPSYAPTREPRRSKKKKEEEVDTDSPTSWPTTYLPSYFPTSPIDFDPRKRFDPLSSRDWDEAETSAGAEHEKGNEVDLSTLYERRACPSPRRSPRESGGGGGESLVERTVEFAYALQSGGSGEDAAGTVQLHILEDVALDLLGCHARASAAGAAGRAGGVLGAAWAEEVWYEENRSVTAMREFLSAAARSA